MKKFGELVRGLRSLAPMKIFFTVAAALFPLFAVLMTELIHFGSYKVLLRTFLERPLVLLFDVLMVGLLYLLTLCILRYFWLSAILTGGLCYLIAVVSHNKYLSLGEYLFPWDFYMAQSAANLTSLSKVTFTFYMGACLVLLLLYAVLLALSGLRLRLRTWGYLLGTVLLVALPLFVFQNASLRSAMYRAAGLYIDPTAEETRIYAENGFIGAFAVNMADIIIRSPENYSEKAVSQRLSDFPATESEDFVKPDIIVILSEAYWDPKKLPDTVFSENPTANFDRLAESSISGLMISPSFGGGTIRPEFEMLTGLTVAGLPSGSYPYKQYISKPIWSFVWHYKDQGYTTKAIHTYKKTFYERDRVYPLLGFDSFLGIEDITEPLPQKGGLPSDAAFMELMINALEEQGDDPLFLFGISMQNHGPYGEKYASIEITATNPNLSESDQHLVSEFAQGVLDADRALGQLCDYLDSRDRPAVLLYFGDHLPTLGVNFELYAAAGFVPSADSSQWTENELISMYGCPYLIYANYDLPQVPTGDTDTVSPYFLMSMLSESIGAPQTSFMSYLSAMQSSVPVSNFRGFFAQEGVSRDEALDLSNFEWMLTYDRLFGGGYSEK